MKVFLVKNNVLIYHPAHTPYGIEATDITSETWEDYKKTLDAFLVARNKLHDEFKNNHDLLLYIHDFYRIFSYATMMLDACDKCIVFEEVKITKDVNIEGNLKLKKGTLFDAVWFSFEHSTFEFIDWMKVDDYNYKPNPKTYVKITQAELVPFLVW